MNDNQNGNNKNYSMSISRISQIPTKRLSKDNSYKNNYNNNNNKNNTNTNNRKSLQLISDKHNNNNNTLLNLSQQSFVTTMPVN